MNTATENNTDQKDHARELSELQVRMVDLQTSMAHLELTVERLDEVITRQDQHIHTLQRQLQLVYKQVESQRTDDGIAPFDVVADKPPHY
jgi:SlyX protein